MKFNFYHLLFGAGLMLSSLMVNAQCDGVRYFSTTAFPGTPTKTTVVYSTTNQSMDIYTPAGDTASKRRLIILAHGGSFVNGDRTESFIVNLCNNFAKRGYVTASIDYRVAGIANIVDMIDSNTAYPHVMRALSDAKAAVRFFRKDAATTNTYKIDSNFIVIGGNSAGAIIATHVAYVKTLGECSPLVASNLNANGGIEGNSGNSGYGSSVQAVLNYAGALLDSSMINAGDIEPIYSAHGDVDKTVPYLKGEVLNGSSNIVVVGSGALKPRLDAQGLKNELHTYPGDDHCPWNTNASKATAVENESVQFLYDLFCTAPTGFNDPDVAMNDIELYPNPANGLLNIKATQHIAAVSIVDQLGRQVKEHINTSAHASISLDGLNTGIYYVKVKYADNTNSVSKRLIIE